MGMSCCGPMDSSSCGSRNFLTKEEKVELLNDYKESLEKETKAVAERITDLKREK